MATFFGEVQFLSSRAYYEEEEETLIERFSVDVSLNLDKKVNCSSLIISFGVLANDFLDGCINVENCHSVGTLQLNKLNTQTDGPDIDFHERVLKPSLLYLTTDGALLCKSSRDITPAITPKIAKLLISLLDESSSVLVLSSHHSSKLNIDSELHGNTKSRIYSIHSDNFDSKHVLYPALPQPSVLDSLPAAIMTECLLQDRKCMTYAAYTDTAAPGDVDLITEDFVKIISRSPFRLKYNAKLTSKKQREDVDRYL